MRKLQMILALTLLAGATPAQAGLVTSRAALGGTDFVDWSDAGAEFTNPTNPFVILSGGGVSLTVSQAGASTFERLNQSSGWGGNFAPGDPLLWTQLENGPITIDFGSTGVTGAGAQIQADFFGDFVARIDAYDEFGVLLGSFTESGTSTSDADNSAIFIGINGVGDIHKIVFSLDSAASSPTDFAINQFDFSTSAVAAVPEPGTLALAGMGIFGLAGYVRRRRAKLVV